SVLREVPPVLERLVSGRVGGPLRAADGEVGRRQRRPERRRQHLVGRERVERLRLRLGKPADAALGPLVLVDRRRVDLDRLGRLQLALEAVEPGGGKPADREVRVTGRGGGRLVGVRRRFYYA